VGRAEGGVADLVGGETEGEGDDGVIVGGVGWEVEGVGGGC